jgi:hypothetical protein
MRSCLGMEVLVMEFWKQIKQEIKCSFGNHDWGESIETDCGPKRTCVHCLDTDNSSLIHNWGAWTRISGACRQRRVCLKGDAEEERNVPHEWSEWERVPNKCERKRFCANCDGSEIQDIPHEWGQATWAGYCQQRRICIRCGDAQMSAPDHKWGKWVSGPDFMVNCQVVRACERCQAEDVPEHRHIFSSWQYEKPNICYLIRVCSRCGFIEKSPTKEHDWTEYEKDTISGKKQRACKHCGYEQDWSLFRPSTWQ